jgi:His/Glu/Gln/Arg/opine family amino acid ABC transporter permease subunit
MNIDYQFIMQALPEIVYYIPVTLKLTVVSFLIALPFGILFGYITFKKVKVLSSIVQVYISLLRGIPLVLQIYVIYNLGPYIVAAWLAKIGSSFNVYDIDNIYYAYFAMSLSTTVSLAEAVRSGLSSVGKGQREAGLSVGLSGPQVFLHIVFPQAMSTAMPVLGNIIVDLIKSTSLAFVMAVTDITGYAKILGSRVFRYFEAYICDMILYIVIIVIVEQIMKLIEKRLSRYRRGVNHKAAA